MSGPGRVLVVGADPGLLRDLAAALSARGLEAVPAADAAGAAALLAAGPAAAVVLDAARVPPADRERLARLRREGGGFALVAVEPASPLSPSQAAPLRRLSWPLPAGFLGQVRAGETPVAFLVEPALFLTQGVQGALRREGVQFFPMENAVGLAEMLAEQLRREEARRAREKPGPAGFWERLSGAAGGTEAPAALGRVAVAQFPGGWAEAAQLDVRLRQAVPGAACYLVTTADPVRAAAAALRSGAPAVLPRECAARLPEALLGAEEAAAAAPRGKERVLLVDNDLPTLSRLSEALLALGYEVQTSLNGDEALRLAAKAPFHLAAIGGSAFEATRLAGANLALRLRERDKDLRIILMVDQFPVQDALKGVSRAVELGLDDAILKPVEASRLALSIQRALERRRLLLENARLLKEVQEQARQLSQINGFQTKFFATVAHDVKNPLTAILGYAEVLGGRLKDRPAEVKCVTHIHSAARTLNLLISDLVDLAAIESGKLRVEIGDLDLAAVVAEVRSRVEVVAQRKRIELGALLPPQIPPMRGDAHRVGQVIQNLCTNAVQYTPDEGRVAIEVSLRPGWATVGVRDTGIGISKEDLPRVWERFFQTREAQAMRKAGFGLGLKIAREIVQMHGGEMGIESELGKGSFFYFTLPLAPAGGAAPEAPGAPTPSAA